MTNQTKQSRFTGESISTESNTRIQYDSVRCRGAAMTNLAHSASFHSNERITPSNRGIKHLEPDTKHDAALIDASITLQRLEDFQHRAFRTLSGGERQRVLLARALVQQPQILVLDEPTNHLDIRYQLSLLSFLREVGVTVIAALHDLNLAAMFCDQLCLMNNGRVVALGEPEDVLTPALLWDVYGVDVTIQNHPHSGKVLVLPGLT